MDDSEIYTRMADHEKIQDLWKEARAGDFYLDRTRPDSPIIAFEYSDFVGLVGPLPRTDLIWLPRPDQLIEMLPDKFHSLDIQPGMVWPYVLHDSSSHENRESFVGKTPEQALIQGVMHQHNLTWHNEQGWTEGVE